MSTQTHKQRMGVVQSKTKDNGRRGKNKLRNTRWVCGRLGKKKRSKTAAQQELFVQMDVCLCRLCVHVYFEIRIMGEHWVRTCDKLTTTTHRK